MIADLIDRAATAFDPDIDVARVLLFQAAAALREPNEQPVDRSATSTVRLVLAPWQLDRIFACIEANVERPRRFPAGKRHEPIVYPIVRHRTDSYSQPA
jgi:hypothetical protein